jgi:acetyl-CoA synthetase
MLIYFTSGTTGYPKAVTHDHTYTLSHIITAKYWQNVKEKGLHLTVAETGWGKASWGKIYGQWLCGCGVMVYDFDKFSPDKLLKVIENYKVTSFCAPPTVYKYFIKRGMDKYDLSSLEHITTAGEALNPEVFQQVYNQTGLKLMEGFGQTESVLMLGNLVGSKAKVGSLGKPTPLYNTKIIDPNNNQLKPMEVGEIVVEPKENQFGIFMDYCGNSELYAKVWENGVYHTGDTAYMDEDGYYWYVGRIDDLIKTRGFRVGPFEIENILMEHPAVIECAVVGVPDESRGQAIKATVKLADGYEQSKELMYELKKFVNKRVADYKHIKYLEFIDEMPKTISGKIKRTELRPGENNIC